MSRENKVIIDRYTYLIGIKGPYVKSGKSLSGALEYNEETDQVKCHECGEWFVRLGGHIAGGHNLSTREYRIKHGLKMSTPLLGERERAKFVNWSSGLTGVPLKKGDNAKYAGKRIAALKDRVHWSNERKNNNGMCQAQVLDKVKRLAEKLGRTPTTKDMRRNGIHLTTLFRVFNTNTIGTILRLANLAPVPIAIGPKYSKPEVEEMVKAFYAQKHRLPTSSDARCRLMPASSVFKRLFGINSVPRASAKILGFRLGDGPIRRSLLCG